MNFTWAAQEASSKGLKRLREALAEKEGEAGASGDGGEAQEYRRRFREAIEDDRITSYNVCYTKLLREVRATGTFLTSRDWLEAKEVREMVLVRGKVHSATRDLMKEISYNFV